MTIAKPTYWFPAKRYGWGWGLPATWQGWVVFGVFAVLLTAVPVVVVQLQNRLVFVLYTLALTAALVGICYWKGEPPRWRWSKD